ncbi:hypothetical protein [Suttonella ornithocola]|uniref:Phage antitermination protein Q n=1 Tax=Suttonella ornithocola TaxID=279832 RepID=A0A380MSS8_9GAMM|nr:hypothetical protein [Suttonella ornithocola]SUO95234.1 Uncharacterised protein [Suttonella ornithocola]
MTNSEVEALLWGYARWARTGEEWRKLGYPPCAEFAKQIPRTIDIDGIPQLTDDEGEKIGRILQSLKQWFPNSFNAIEARFFYGIFSDKDVVRNRRWKFTNAENVRQKRQHAYTFIIAKIVP